MHFKDYIVLVLSLFFSLVITGCEGDETTVISYGSTYKTFNQFVNDTTLCGQEINCLTDYSPPYIEGNYDQDATITYSDFDEEGLDIVSGWIFRNQSYGEISVLEYYEFLGYKSYGNGLFLRGSGNQFTTYQSTAANIEGCDCTQYGALVASGTKSTVDGDIDNWKGIWKLTGAKGDDCDDIGIADYIGGYKKYSGTLVWNNSNTADPF